LESSYGVPELPKSREYSGKIRKDDQSTPYADDTMGKSDPTQALEN